MTWSARSSAAQSRSGRCWHASGRCWATCPASHTAPPRRHRRGSTPRRWSRSARTATRSRPAWRGCGSAPRSARGRSLIWHDGKVIATERLAGRHGTSAQLEHYLDLLARKPGALARSLALRQERDRGDWPRCFDRLWSEIEGKAGRTEAARQMVDVLLLCREIGPPAGRAGGARRPCRRRPRRQSGGASWRGAPNDRRRRVLQLEERLAGIRRPRRRQTSGGYDRLREAV